MILCIEFENLELICLRFVEGPDVTLADLMLLASDHMSLFCLNRSIGKQLLPKTNHWLKRASLDPRFSEGISVLNEAVKDLPKACKISTILPPVPEESLYKRDPERYVFQIFFLEFPLLIWFLFGLGIIRNIGFTRGRVNWKKCSRNLKVSLHFQ